MQWFWNRRLLQDFREVAADEAAYTPRPIPAAEMKLNARGRLCSGVSAATVGAMQTAQIDIAGQTGGKRNQKWSLRQDCSTGSDRCNQTQRYCQTTSGCPIV